MNYSYSNPHPFEFQEQQNDWSIGMCNADVSVEEYVEENVEEYHPVEPMEALNNDSSALSDVKDGELMNLSFHRGGLYSADFMQLFAVPHSVEKDRLNFPDPPSHEFVLSPGSCSFQSFINILIRQINQFSVFF